MEFDEAVEKRFSCRVFKNKKASWKDVLLAIDAANQGPFAGNHNHLHYIIVEDERNIAEIAKHADQHWIAQAGILVVVMSDDKHLEDLYGLRGRVYSRQQSGAAISTMLLKLADLGLASCWVGAYSDEKIKNVLRMPHNFQVEAIIPVGYAAEKHIRRRKKPLENTLYWEYWDKWKRPHPIKEKVDADPSSLY